MIWRASIITLMPHMYPGPLGCSLVGDAFLQGRAALDIINLRDFGIGVHQKVDDTPYGGGAGMVLKADVMDAAITEAKRRQPDATLVHLSPRGEHFTQHHAQQLLARPTIFIAGRYEGIDERVLQKYQPLNLSLGDFVLTGGDIAAMAMIEACVRLIPGVVGDSASLDEESFGLDEDYACLLEYPHYTKPPVWEGMPIPDILLSGHHAHIAKWRKQQAERLTQALRPDLWAEYNRRRATLSS